jgi:phage shock protein C
MSTTDQNLFTRDDTFLGICEGLGEDLGINPDLFRVAMIPALFFFPVHTLAAYLGAGILVLFTRLVFPVHGRKAKKARTALQPAPSSAAVEARVTEADTVKELELAA